MILRKNLASAELPAQEYLLADKEEHIIPRDGIDPFQW